MAIERAMWAKGLGIGALLLAAGGCTRPNGAFDDTQGVGSESTDAQTQPDPTGGTTVSTQPNPTDGTTSPGTTVGTTSDVPDGTTADTGPSDTEATTGDPLCDLHDDLSFEITVRDGAGGIIEPPAGCDQVLIRTNGTVAPDGGGFVHEQCDCGCATEGEITTVDFGGALTLPVFPECVGLAVWPRMTDAGCKWDGFALLDSGAPELPMYLGNNSTVLPESVFGVVDVHLVPDGPACDPLPGAPRGCTPPPGPQALEFFSETPVFVGAPQAVDIGFVVGLLPFEVDNRTSAVTQLCTEQVSWTALRRG